MSISPLDLQIAFIQIGRVGQQYSQILSTPRKKQLNQAIKHQNKSHALNTQIQESPENIDISLNIELDTQHKTNTENPPKHKITLPHKKIHKTDRKKSHEAHKGIHIDLFE